MLRILPAVVVLSLVVAYGVAEGWWTDRWQTSRELEEAAGRLARVPRTVGTWQADDQDEPVGEREVRVGSLRGHVRRRYTDTKTGETVTVLVVCGRPGPISAHSPHVCFRGAGYDPVGKRTVKRVEVEGRSTPAEFWSERYAKTEAAFAEPFHVYYAWNSGTGWRASGNPRIDFVAARALYKLYVVREITRKEDEDKDAKDPALDFLSQYVPVLDDCLFQTP
jgi:hypothetical protein